MAAELPAPIHVLGHSFGATAALAASSLLGERLGRLVLYEPYPGLQPDDPGLLDRMDALLAAGDREGLVEAFFREGLRVGEAEWHAIRSSPRWPGRLLAEAHTIPRQWRAESSYRDFACPAVPALLLVGTEGPWWALEGVQIVAAALPDARIVTLAGEGHDGCRTAPERIAAEFLAFLGA